MARKKELVARSSTSLRLVSFAAATFISSFMLTLRGLWSAAIALKLGCPWG